MFLRLAVYILNIITLNNILNFKGLNMIKYIYLYVEIIILIKLTVSDFYNYIL